MAVRKILKYGEPLLTEKMKPVEYEKIKDMLPELLQDMWETCLFANGAGLSANQIGLPLRLAIIIISEKKKPVKMLTLINPRFTEKLGEMREEEGCLSLPGLFADTRRYAHVKVEALNDRGLPIEISAQGFMAKALQHEIDHLDGKLFIDHVEPMQKNQVKAKIKTMKKKWASIDEAKMALDENRVHGNAKSGGSLSKKTK